MSSAIPLLALALVLQTDPASTPVAGPATSDDPIGALMNSVQQEEGEDGAPPEPAAPTSAPNSAPNSTTPSQPLPYAPSLPAGPRPYTSLPTTPGGVRPIYAQPLVRLPPKPQGLLDGGWTLVEARGGGQLYQFQFNDTGGGNEIEGAWRDVRRSGALLGSGPVSSVGYDGVEATIRFLEKGAGEMSVVTLRPQGGGWSGTLRGRTGESPVVMRRN